MYCMNFSLCVRQRVKSEEVFRCENPIYDEYVRYTLYSAYMKCVYLREYTHAYNVQFVYIRRVSYMYVCAYYTCVLNETCHIYSVHKIISLNFSSPSSFSSINVPCTIHSYLLTRIHTHTHTQTCTAYTLHSQLVQHNWIHTFIIQQRVPTHVCVHA